MSVLGVGHSLPFVVAGVVKLLRAQMDDELTALLTEAGETIPGPAAWDAGWIVVGDERFPPPNGEWLRVEVTQTGLSPTASLGEAVARYEVRLFAATNAQDIREPDPSSSATDPDYTVRSSGQLRAMLICEAAARALEGSCADGTIPGAYNAARLPPPTFIPRQAATYGHAAVIELTCRSAYAQGAI